MLPVSSGGMTGAVASPGADVRGAFSAPFGGILRLRSSVVVTAFHRQLSFLSAGDYAVTYRVRFFFSAQLGGNGESEFHGNAHSRGGYAAAVANNIADACHGAAKLALKAGVTGGAVAVEIARCPSTLGAAHMAQR